MIFPSLISFANDDIPTAIYPNVSSTSSTIEGFTPSGWYLEYQQKGDLNSDGIADVVLVLHEKNPKNILKNEGFGAEVTDTNPRILLVAVRDKVSDKYIKLVENHTLIPRHTDPTLEDSLTESAIKISKGNLIIRLEYFANAGSWEMFSATFTFRKEDQCLSLIGYDRVNTHRASGETSDISINFLTNKAKVSRGNIEDENLKPTWQSIKNSKKHCLQEVGNGLEFTPPL